MNTRLNLRAARPFVAASAAILMVGCEDLGPEIDGPFVAHEASQPISDAGWELRAVETLRPGTADALDCDTWVEFLLSSDGGRLDILHIEPIDGEQRCYRSDGSLELRSVRLEPTTGRVWWSAEGKMLELQFAFGEDTDVLRYQGRFMDDEDVMSGSDEARSWEALPARN